MLAIQKSSSHKGKFTPHLLPCRIHHNGPVNASKRYWDPKTTAGVGKESKPTSYFRGRKLHGKTLAIPKGYRGVVLARSDRVLPPKPDGSTINQEDGDMEEEGVSEVKIVEEQAEFGSVVVWGHECLPDEMADAYCRGVEEWIGFAEMIHGEEEEGGK
ncbi:hypothetical protein HYALB_00007335 [Hymenoscyphus albidus]|uniref:Uncharacterized protein n=1 Tax=Hymenoscyphus albidus TaxID=595503 RepID=A0A9N9PRA0_9HELO|nr:hypothetical protein HYALB_00007335 [Hymenoscyphus albidus]